MTLQIALDVVTRNRCVLMWAKPCERQLPCEAPEAWLPWLHLSDNYLTCCQTSVNLGLRDLVVSLILIAEELFHVCIRPRLQGQEELGYERGVPLSTAYA